MLGVNNASSDPSLKWNRIIFDRPRVLAGWPHEPFSSFVTTFYSEAARKWIFHPEVVGGLFHLAFWVPLYTMVPQTDLWIQLLTQRANRYAQMKRKEPARDSQ